MRPYGEKPRHMRDCPCCDFNRGARHQVDRLRDRKVARRDGRSEVKDQLEGLACDPSSGDTVSTGRDSPP